MGHRHAVSIGGSSGRNPKSGKTSGPNVVISTMVVPSIPYHIERGGTVRSLAPRPDVVGYRRLAVGASGDQPLSPGFSAPKRSRRTRPRRDGPRSEALEEAWRIAPDLPEPITAAGSARA